MYDPTVSEVKSEELSSPADAAAAISLYLVGSAVAVLLSTLLL